MLHFKDWTIQADGDILARQFDNLTRTLTVAGDIPAGWEWAVLVQVGNAMDIIPLTATEGALSAVLTAQQLSIAGYYQMQLRATQGDKVQHTNTVNVYISASLSGDEQWPTVPSEFSDMERRINEKAAQVEGYSTHPPTVGENGNWWEWDGTDYVDTGSPSQGEPGPKGEDAYAKAVEYGFEGTEEEFYLALAAFQAAVEGKVNASGDTMTGPLYYKSTSNQFLRTDNIVSWAITNLDEWTPLFSAFKMCRIQKTSYTGTGAYGETKAKKITFDFQPKLVIIKKKGDLKTTPGGSEIVTGVNEAVMFAVYGEPVSVSSRFYGEKGYAYPTHLTWSGKTLSFWGTSETRHLNYTGHVYNVLAIG